MTGNTFADNHRCMKKVFALLVFFSLVTKGFADGSMSTEEVLAILKKNKVLHEYVTSTLELDSVASGVRLGRHFEELGGLRVGPYQLMAKPKGAEDFTMVLVVECSQEFVDKDGKVFDMDTDFEEATKKAVDVKEEVISVSLTAVEE